MTRILRMVGAVLTAALIVSAPAAASAATLDSVAGDTRYATAIAISQATYPAGAPAVVLATAASWPDALGGSGLAGALFAPVLLTARDRVPAGVVVEIERLGATEVRVLGGPAAVSDAALHGLREALPGVSVVRVGGVTRYATAAEVASATIAARTWDGEAFVATGRSFHDALALGPVAASLGRPLYLIDEGTAADGVIAAMDAAGVTHATIVGGTAVVSASLQARIAKVTCGVSRIAGTDRYATALAIAAYAQANAGFTWIRPGLATADDFADALAAAPLLGQRRSPLLLAPRAGLTDRTTAELYSRRTAVDGFVCFGGSAALPLHVRQEALHALAAPGFDINRAMEHVTVIAGYGARPAGGAAERQACDYVAAQLRSWGYTVTTQDIVLPGGKHSRNIIAEHAGTRPEVIVLGAHIDSKYPSPGANDNASGVGVTLELARVFAQATTTPTVRFIAFGAEEIAGDTADAHHFGSRQYVAALSSAGKTGISGMVSVDMVGYGTTFNVRSLGTGPQTVVSALRTRAGYVGLPLPYLKDFGRYGWSDHEGFERAGVPAAWLEWREDPVYHTVRDTASHVQASRVRTTGRLLRGWILGMDAAKFDALR
ncbi:MAG: cell wall-binding repeat-containing protein [Coriobacteriia bacterium]